MLLKLLGPSNQIAQLTCSFFLLLYLDSCLLWFHRHQVNPRTPPLSRMHDLAPRDVWEIKCSSGKDLLVVVKQDDPLFCSLLDHRAGVLHAAAACQVEPSVTWSSLRSVGTPLAQGGSGHGLHLHSVFNLPSTTVVQLGSQIETQTPDNATAWQPAVFDCSRAPLLLSGYFQHVECVGPASLASRSNQC